MKYCIVTRADDNIKEMTKLTFPGIQEYAERIGADFKVLSHTPPVMTDDNRPHYRIFEVGNLLDEYDRILCLDCDVIINKDCPNIFDVVPVNKVGSIFEDKGTRKPDRLTKIRGIQNKWGDVNWVEGYTNAGTFVVSKQHKNIFTTHNDKYWLDWGSADLHLSYNIHKYGHKIHELDFKWNHMTLFSEPWNNNADRFKSYIIHYAGGGIFDVGVGSRKHQMELDLGRLSK
tara:strand:- start:272 stop:961 length:690 start_codon:yes stop_codon:yes gene_type:complete